MKIITDGLLEGLSTRADGSIAFKFATQEIDPQHAADLFRLRGKYCKVLISDSNITTLEAELVDTQKLVGEKKQTKSQWLRGILFRVHEQSGSTIAFDDFYNLEINRIGEHYKSKLQ